MKPIEILIAPPFLKKGDKIAIIGLASKLAKEDIDQAVNILEKDWGLEVIIGESIGAVYHGFSGDDELRRRNFQEMLDNSAIKAIFSARGGYGSAKIIDNINWKNFKKSPKWVIGFSDITAVIGKINRLGYQAIHGPMPKTMTKDEFSTNSLKNILFGEKTHYKVESTSSFNKQGKTKGQFVGGNLCLIANQIGTKSALNTTGKILFLEDIGEYYYSLDRMLVHLKRAGLLTHLAGLVVGQFSDCKEDAESFGKTIYEIVSELTAEYNYPICFDFPFGHECKNYPITMGQCGTLFVTDKDIEIEF